MMKEYLHKFLVEEEIPYEGKNTWTVMASSKEEARAFVKNSGESFGNSLYVDTLKFNVTGTKEKGIIKKSLH